MSDVSQQVGTLGKTRARVAAAAVIMTMDGFDSFSLSLMAPLITRELEIPAATLGLVFASAMGGMTIGALVGGTLADRFGRLRLLFVSILLFALAALTMPLVGSPGEIILNRAIAGMGLGAAGPIATSLLNRPGEKPPGEFAVALVWSGIAIGGCLAALFNYVFAATYGWRLIFIVGGLLPIPVAICTYFVFRDTPSGVPSGGMDRAAARPRISGLFTHGRAARTFIVAGMFFFGFVTTSIMVYWLPTVLSHLAASSFMISATFAGINGGSVVGMLLLGFLASRGRSARIRTWTWASAGLCGLGASLLSGNAAMIALLAIIGATIAAGGQSLAISLANDLHRTTGLQATSVGFMTAAGRIGQFSALGISGVIVAWSGQETVVFALAGVAALLAALLSAIAARSMEKHVAPV
ncbi:MFS transporter [Sphingomonas sp. SRS2]|uniref:MFS transporter n=1 Tax=Sphingomonas sp. SRS2 TaxID=133190 RepID=UPI00061EDED3|nr:MFS transporter [Sphingomonas sp. SRS2]KKC26654.1 hypothetical protein WP12_06800 [Sphingomonas sp. SRS2]